MNPRDTAYNRLSQLSLPGPSYLEVLAQIHQILRTRTYVEIGVASGASLRLARDSRRIVGIDPQPTAEDLPSGTHIVPMPSQAYLAGEELRDALDGGAFDLAFVDGSHLFEDTLSDVLQLERFSARHSLILVHDCLPLDEASASRRRATGFWTGDVWKLVPCLRRLCPDLTITTIATAPSGLCLISGLDASARRKTASWDAAAAEIAAWEFSRFKPLRDLFALRAPDADAVAGTLRDDHPALSRDHRA